VVPLIRHADPAFNGALLAEEQDIVTVAIKCAKPPISVICTQITYSFSSYRLSVFGFPGVALPEKNLGLLDQRLAVEWLRDK
jgi:hypothetical protein